MYVNDANRMADKRKSFSTTAVVNIVFPAEKLTKKMLLNLDMKATETISYIVEKRKQAVPMPLKSKLSDYGLFVPPTGTLRAEWIKDNDPLNYYYIEQRGACEIRLKPQTIFIKPFNSNIEKNLEVDFDCPVANLLPKIMSALKLHKAGTAFKYVLYKAALTLNQSLSEQNVPFRATLIIKRKVKSTGLDILNKYGKFLKGKVGAKVSTETKKSDKIVFGLPMAEVLQRTNTKIVPVVQKCLDYLEKALTVEGIFRLSGNSADIVNMKKTVDSGADLDIAGVADPHAVAGLLKMYLRELPDPLLTFSLYWAFLAIEHHSQESHKVAYLNVLLQQLPKENIYLLEKLCKFLFRVSEKCEENKMNVANIATCFAPCVFKAENALQMIEDSPATNRIVQILISNANTIFQNNKTEFIGIAKAIHEYSGVEGYELELKIVSEDDSGWWTGESNGKRGMFPNNYVELFMLFDTDLEDEDETMFVGESEVTSSSPAGRVKAQTLRPKRIVPKEEEGITASFMQSEFSQQQYEEEKQKRIEMENMVKVLQESVQALKVEISSMRVSNEKLVTLLSKVPVQKR